MQQRNYTTLLVRLLLVSSASYTVRLQNSPPAGDRVCPRPAPAHPYAQCLCLRPRLLRQSRPTPPAHVWPSDGRHGACQAAICPPDDQLPPSSPPSRWWFVITTCERGSPSAQATLGQGRTRLLVAARDHRGLCPDRDEAYAILHRCCHCATDHGRLVLADSTIAALEHRRAKAQRYLS